MKQDQEWDVFISYAWEDKESFVRQLAEALRDKGLRVWYDEFEVAVGDSLRHAIDQGLARSKYGIVILSPAFFDKSWPRAELAGLLARQHFENRGVILPVWHNLTPNEVAKYSPELAGRVGISTNRGLDHVVSSLLESIRQRDLSAAPERTLEGRIAQLLIENGISFEFSVSIGGLQPDFLVHGPRDQLIVLEVKAWRGSPGLIKRAANQARMYQHVLGADGAIIVLDTLDQDTQIESVVTVGQLLGALHREFEKPGMASRSLTINHVEKKVFAAMPFSSNYDDVFFVAMAHAAQAIDAVCTRVDIEEFEGDVVDEIKQLIKGSVAVIVDLSESRPNVLYEAGYTHALGLPAVHICSTPLTDLPFDVRNWNTLSYTPGQTYQLRDPLARRLRAVIR